jgi:hypothetical protein
MEGLKVIEKEMQLLEWISLFEVMLLKLVVELNP